MNSKDCSGLACPQPVLAARDLIAAHPGEALEIIVDNQAARQNVGRFLESQGFEVSCESLDNQKISVKGSPCSCTVMQITPGSREAGGQKILVFIPSDSLGEGNPDLGGRLMLNFIRTLEELGTDLWRIVLVNSGVKLAIRDSEYLDELTALERRGITILVCGTCLEFFNLLPDKAVGETTNMLDIVTSMHLASKIIRV